uniref:NADH-ubiquinone oxidoreductase chain 6 n=1 Tax=Achilidae gen. 1 sp. n. 1 SX-2018 TaxID=2232070 RepID=A0A3S5XHN9_9HEMI|nr:NADH dehydrogenase subunit 6 [Achilidae gen. 1 sp. n. 1 SX-2018]
MKTMTMMMLMNSVISLNMNHPLSMGFMLTVQTTIMCLYSSTLMSSPWFGYILFIIMIGGMMVMFMYMSSIASNEKFKLMKMKSILIITMMMTVIATITNQDLSLEETFKMMENKTIIISNEEMKSTAKFMTKFKSNLTILIMLILLLTMISVTNISSTFEGPLKKTYV